MPEPAETPERIICVEPRGGGEPFSIPYGSLRPKSTAPPTQTPTPTPTPTSTTQPTNQPKK